MSETVNRGVTVASKFGAVFLAGWFASSAYHTTLEHAQKAAALTALQTQVIPKLASVAGCQAKRAQIATSEAVKSKNGDDIDLAQIPNCPAPKAAVAVPETGAAH